MTDRNEKYKTDWHRCGTCRTRRATWQSMLKHFREHPECKPCHCDGYGKEHRPNAKYCVNHPDHLVHRAIRAGDHSAAVLLRGVKGGDEPPF